MHETYQYVLMLWTSCFGYKFILNSREYLGFIQTLTTKALFEFESLTACAERPNQSIIDNISEAMVYNVRTTFTSTSRNHPYEIEN